MYWPIIYVRGYAMTRGEIDETTADPFCGFNIGSVMMRARPDKDEPPKKFIFESPVVRLQSDFGYRDIYEDGIDIVDPDWKGGIDLRSIVIYRYYEQAATVFRKKGEKAKTPDIEEFAKGLSDLILRVRDRACEKPANEIKPKDFRCYLVAHSMGGLVCRAFLQNPRLGRDEARDCVDKFFTYATPHNGIEVTGLDINVPEFLGAMDISNFNRKRMAKYLNVQSLYDKTERVDWMPEDVFPSRHVFCMVGTNRLDYEAGAGLSRTFVGHGSDGLVRVANASVWGVNAKGKFSRPSSTAYAYRAHSGRFGIVNSEESYQNLRSFLFGNLRVDIWVDLDEVLVPEALEQDDKKGKVDALYQIEVQASPEGKRWFLTRRKAEEDSVACRTHQQLRDTKNPEARRVYLSTVFLENRHKVDEKQNELVYGLSLGIRVPDYEVEKRFWPNSHFEGQYLFNDSLVVKLIPPRSQDGGWTVLSDWAKDDVAQATTPVDTKKLKGGEVEVEIGFKSSDNTPPRSPGVSGRLRFVVSPWNVGPRKS